MKYNFLFIFINFICLTSSCQQNDNNSDEKAKSTMENTHKHTNALINETSPYLLQHAHNPVNWHAWGEEAIQKAKDENKLILVSIGYSACHWCHVMERESFEDEEVAAYMNQHFICIKVDREERPDVDQIYMEAVQLITGRGGWPLNCFALPDGRPFYGGTYFPKKNWLYLLENITKEYENDPKKIEQYATDLTAGINKNEFEVVNQEKIDQKALLIQTVEKWKLDFDQTEGGPNRSPKFPIPNNYMFLLDYAMLFDDQSVLNHVELTLDKMAYGGIYDQVGGGFARYSTDKIWKAPHFEKMLYDNAQLITLYSKAYQHFKKDAYKRVVEQTLAFIEREMTGPDGEFYSALDADSEGEEGKFYVWTKEELETLEQLDQDFVSALYSIQPKYVWEHGNYILHRQAGDQKLMRQFELSQEELIEKIDFTNQVLLEERSNRIRPGLDDKTLTSWNALMISGYAAAYKTFGDEKHLEKALKNAHFLWKNQYDKKDGLLHNYKKGISSISGFLEDYAFVIEAYLDLYEVTFDEEWIERAQILSKESIDNFFNSEQKMFYFSANKDALLIARKMEISDNVIPASNSSIARSFHRLGLLLDDRSLLDISNNMLAQVSPRISSYGSGYSNWSLLSLTKTNPYFEIAIVGDQYVEKLKALNKEYLPNAVFLGGKKEGNLPLLENKLVKGTTMIYVCLDQTCKIPVEEVKEAATLINESR